MSIVTNDFVRVLDGLSSVIEYSIPQVACTEKRLCYAKQNSSQRSACRRGS